ncbi:MAG: hypothetical protein V4713_03510 [Pseudomonadota bacterium]
MIETNPSSDSAIPLMNRASEQVNLLGKRGLHSVRETSQQLRNKALRVSDSTVKYVKDEPVNAMLIAAAAGAAVTAIFSRIIRSRSHG